MPRYHEFGEEMVQKGVLEEAIKRLLRGYRDKIEGYSIDDFLKADVDPFRFGFNVELGGLEHAVRKEIEHKIEMSLEDLFGDFHENYLGNARHVPSNTGWRILPKGAVQGVDITNEKYDWNLQIKSKHNSMNSSSAKKLAEQLKKLSEMRLEGIFGCGWVIAGPKRKCIGESEIAKVAKVYKGKELYRFVTGNTNDMDEVLETFPRILKDAKKEMDFGGLIKQATERVLNELEKRAKARKLTVVKYLYEEAVK
jgi:hypothetical protein